MHYIDGRNSSGTNNRKMRHLWTCKNFIILCVVSIQMSVVCYAEYAATTAEAATLSSTPSAASSSVVVDTGATTSSPTSTNSADITKMAYTARSLSIPTSDCMEGNNNNNVAVVNAFINIDDTETSNSLLNNGKKNGKEAHVDNDQIQQPQLQQEVDHSNLMLLQHYYHYSRIAYQEQEEVKKNNTHALYSTIRTPFDQCNKFAQVDREENWDFTDCDNNCTIQEDGTSIYTCDEFKHCLFCNEEQTICVLYKYDYVFDFDVEYTIKDDEDNLDPIAFSYSRDIYQYVSTSEYGKGDDIIGTFWNDATIKIYNYFSNNKHKIEINDMVCNSIEEVLCPPYGQLDFKIDCTNLSSHVLHPDEHKDKLVYECGNGHDIFQFLHDPDFNRCQVSPEYMIVII